MMSLTFGLFTQVSGSGPLGPLVLSWESCFEAFYAVDNRNSNKLFCYIFIKSLAKLAFSFSGELF